MPIRPIIDQATPMIRGTMFFNMEGARQSWGWSESHYFPGAATLDDGITRISALVAARVLLLGNKVTNVYNRVSDDRVFRDSRVLDGVRPLFLPKGPVYNPDFQGAGWVADFATSDYMLRMEADTPFLYRRSHWLAGNPDEVQSIDLDSPNSAAWVRAFRQYNAVLVGGGQNPPVPAAGQYGMRVLNKDASLTKGILSISNTGVITANAHGLQPGNPVRISRVHVGGNVVNPNGVWQVSADPAPTVNTFTVNGIGPGFTYTYGGQVTLLKFIVVPYKRIIGRRFGMHKKGRPFDLPHGKRTALRR